MKAGRPWTVIVCGICGRLKEWISGDFNIGSRLRMCPCCDRAPG